MDPTARDFEKRVRRYAGFYMGDDPQSPNYDKEHKIIRSLFNGSRGPLLRKATALDWAGDPLDEVEVRFNALHGERNFEEMLAHFEDYTDVVGDHPSNMVATSLGLNAFALTGEACYRDWVMEYAEAWRQRTIDNDVIIPRTSKPDVQVNTPGEGTRVPAQVVVPCETGTPRPILGIDQRQPA